VCFRHNGVPTPQDQEVGFAAGEEGTAMAATTQHRPSPTWPMIAIRYSAWFTRQTRLRVGALRRASEVDTALPIPLPERMSSPWDQSHGPARIAVFVFQLDPDLTSQGPNL
jgi:hypothetical protein